MVARNGAEYITILGILLRNSSLFIDLYSRDSVAKQCEADVTDTLGKY